MRSLCSEMVSVLKYPEYPFGVCYLASYRNSSRDPEVPGGWQQFAHCGFCEVQVPSAICARPNTSNVPRSRQDAGCNLCLSQTYEHQAVDRLKLAICDCTRTYIVIMSTNGRFLKSSAPVFACFAACLLTSTAFEQRSRRRHSGWSM